jgi:hypothetical protein
VLDSELGFVVVFRSPAGGRPAATYLFCFAKKGKPKKATAPSLPFGFPFVQVKKWEMSTTRYAQTWTFLIHFLPYTNGSARSGMQVKGNGEIAIGSESVRKIRITRGKIHEKLIKFQ